MKNTYKAGDDFKNLIEMIQLTDIDKETLRVQWLNELNYADAKAGENKRKLNQIKLLVFVSGVLIPVFANVKFNLQYGPFEFSNLLLTTILGVAVSIGTGLNQIFKYEDQWMLYRRNAELLKSEGENFFGLGGAYSASESHQRAVHDFNTNVGAIKRQDVSSYFEKVITKKEGE